MFTAQCIPDAFEVGSAQRAGVQAIAWTTILVPDHAIPIRTNAFFRTGVVNQSGLPELFQTYYSGIVSDFFPYQRNVIFIQ